MHNIRHLKDMYGEEVRVTGNVIKYSLSSDYKKVALVKDALVESDEIKRIIDHIWVNANLALTGKVGFRACVKAYQKKNGSWNYGFANEINLLKS